MAFSSSRSCATRCSASRPVAVARRPHTVPDCPVVCGPDELLTTVVDVGHYVDRKREAFRAHVSQNSPTMTFMEVPDEELRRAFGREHYQLARGDLGAPAPEPDLFAGVSG